MNSKMSEPAPFHESLSFEKSSSVVLLGSPALRTKLYAISSGLNAREQNLKRCLVGTPSAKHVFCGIDSAILLESL